MATIFQDITDIVELNIKLALCLSQYKEYNLNIWDAIGDINEEEKISVTLNKIQDLKIRHDDLLSITEGRYKDMLNNNIVDSNTSPIIRKIILSIERLLELNKINEDIDLENITRLILEIQMYLTYWMTKGKA